MGCPQAAKSLQAVVKLSELCGPEAARSCSLEPRRTVGYRRVGGCFLCLYAHDCLWEGWMYMERLVVKRAPNKYLTEVPCALI